MNITNEKNKEITNTELLESINRSFVDVLEKTNTELLESINRSFSKMEEKMATKDELRKSISEVKEEIHDLRMDLKSFKKDTEDSVKEVKVDVTDLFDTVMHQDKRIEKLETKVFV